jgi:hypothetical protein
MNEGKNKRISIRRSRYRRWILLLILLLIFAEICTALSANRAQDIITAVFTIIGAVVMIHLLTMLTVKRSSSFFRVIIFMPVMVYLVFKLWILYELLTQVEFFP